MGNELHMALVRLRRDIMLHDKGKAMEGIEAARKFLPVDTENSENTLYKVVSVSLAEAERLISEGSFDNAYDLVDAVHCLPEIAACEKRDMEAYWRCHIEVYQGKWQSELFSEFENDILKM